MRDLLEVELSHLVVEMGCPNLAEEQRAGTEVAWKIKSLLEEEAKVKQVAHTCGIEVRDMDLTGGVFRLAVDCLTVKLEVLLLEGTYEGF